METLPNYDLTGRPVCEWYTLPYAQYTMCVEICINDAFILGGVGIFHAGSIQQVDWVDTLHIHVYNNLLASLFLI